MSTFKNFFGGKKTDKLTSNQALDKLRNVQDMLIKKQNFLEKKIACEIATAKKHGLANKRAALQALGRKKRYEAQLCKLDGTLTTIEFQIEALDNAGTNVEVMGAMRTAADALKAAHKNMKVDDVHDIMDEIQEQQDVAEEISNAISNPAGLGTDFDEDELLAELEELQEKDLADTLLDVGPADHLPTVPATDLAAAETASKSRQQAVKSKEQQEEDEMAALAEWAS